MAIADNLADIHQRIDAAMIKSGRKDRPTLIAVSKTKPVDLVAQAMTAGQCDFGENYLQDALLKIRELSLYSRPGENKKINWHFIGALQSNKTRQIAEHFDWVHTVDRLKIAERLNDQRPEYLPALNICLQVNLADEETKSGVIPDECLVLAEKIVRLPKLSVRGLMAIPKKLVGFEAQYQQFLQLARLRDDLVQRGLAISELSMGMSADLEAAICAGATMLRVGTDIFGARN
ncbi:pyridoxal phosphate enzyme, YggS family [Piscirickettsia salmonis]|uniref:Pyridoxal phosphate homeostasis protein n=1 Tax=Piscirickettsia salmonis TaxID=1238 RepID=A0A1L6TFV5_PISSA|nr:YggS family pyridoxal phosphate-dependent enzyme [Piscirickettsia salmonis]AKP74793.1 alanine racemase [Piscirickettsia salmonis LF-89 = ATCC VR-1361]ALB21275.1 alanine racemase [Piscirickettsia salmonis]ALY01524.1 alanine racemase [Piscirickettsia salmonis]AMA41037.1 alanine racemase [Piscirickettsia salmonis]AOS36226.1 alanine racemase [Piscirickettsia salmonis]